MTTVAAIVEGDGEVLAVPALIRRVAYTHGVYDVDVPRPFLLSRDRFLIPEQFDNAVENRARRIGDTGGILALLDADDDCALKLIERIRGSYRGGRGFALVVAVREYESLFLVNAVPDPEDIRDAKGVVRRLTGVYKETRHQQKLSATLDLELARECKWFRKFERELLGILGR
jgi:hypothetical protein